MPLRFRPGTPQEPCISGINTESVVRSMREVYGEAAFSRALAALAPAQREEISEVHAMRWVRSATLDAMVEALADVVHRTPDSIWDELMRHGSERWFRFAWRVLLGLLSDDALVARSSIVFSRTRNCGELTGQMTSPGRADLRLREWPGVPARNVRNFALAIEAILTASGRADPRVRWERTDDGAHLTLTWRVRR
jgi:hypothetical protein